MDQAEETTQTEEQNPHVAADSTIKYHMYGAMGVGLIPLPMVDLVALTGVHINMLRKLAKAYDVPFMQDKVKNILASLVGGSLPVGLAGAFASLIKTIPVVGQTTGVLALPILAGATTYAVGRVFKQHFASGGTFLNFDPEAVREYYEKMLKEGKKVASAMKPSAGATSDANKS